MVVRRPGRRNPSGESGCSPDRRGVPASGLKAETEALAAAQLQHLEGTREIGRPMALQQGHEGQAFRRRFRIGAVGVALIAEVAVAEGHGPQATSLEGMPQRVRGGELWLVQACRRPMDAR